MGNDARIPLLHRWCFVPVDRNGFIRWRWEARNHRDDVVLTINVVHHVPNPFAFLDRAASLTRSHLVLEYPGLVDEKYKRTLPGGTPDLDDSLPLLGVSTRDEDQTGKYNAMVKNLLDNGYCESCVDTVLKYAANNLWKD